MSDTKTTDVSFDEEALRAEARARTGLTDFGDEGFRDGFRVLLQTYDTTMRLTPRARKSTRRRIVGLLENRLRIEAELTRNPDIRARTIERPLYLTGLPRTGTSALFNLLACDPVNRPLLFWEGTHPDPLPGLLPGAEDPRLTALREGLERAREANPDFAKIHDVRADGAEECIQLLAHSMVGIQLGTEPLVSPYREHFLSQDLRPVYRYYADLLRLIDWQRPGKRWLLKSPAHLWALDALLLVVPDACVVVTHRDPRECVPSYCSMMQALMVEREHVDPQELGPVVLEFLALSAERAMKARDALDAARFVDVRYVDFVADPLATGRRIYDAFGLPFGADVQAALRAGVAQNPQNKHGKHDYQLAKYGLTEAQVLDRLADYVKRYDVPIAR